VKLCSCIPKCKTVLFNRTLITELLGSYKSPESRNRDFTDGVEFGLKNNNGLSPNSASKIF